MALPINVDDLLSGSTVEWARLECKKGWNPEAVVRTMCAFANDLHNWGGGYIVIGVEERDGRPVLPPKGLSVEKVDWIQKELVNLSNRVIPSYFPVVEPVLVSGKTVVIVWAPGGENRPYKAPVSLAKGSAFAYYVRVGSSSVAAKGPIEQELMQLAAKVPFDDRINHHAEIVDLSRGLIQAHLDAVRSDLVSDSHEMDMVQLGRQMRIISGTVENPRPLNVGLLFFCEEPHQFFDTAWIDVVHMPGGPSGQEIREKRFSGPLDQQLRSALEHIRSHFIEQRTIKKAGIAEADRFYTYPYQAVEEALANAIYHRGYDVREPTEVRITPTEITITSYPGPDPSVRVADLKTGQVVARRYRNRRVGEFLKDLRLTEGRGTGIPTILRAMRDNGSPEPVFETDEDRLYFTTRLKIHPEAAPGIGAGSGGEGSLGSSDIVSDTASDTASDEADRIREAVPEIADPAVALKILDAARQPRSRRELQASTNMKHGSYFLKRYLAPLMEASLLEFTIPDSPSAPNQRYLSTAQGLRILRKKHRQTDG